MASSWGCCTNLSDDEQFINCVRCHKSHHFACLSIPEIAVDSDAYGKWNCPSCMIKLMKSTKKEYTPNRNVSNARGNKRPALNSPPQTAAITTKDVRNIVQEVIRTEFALVLQQIDKSILNAINKELEPIRREILDLSTSLNYHTKEFEQFQSEQKTL